MFVEVDNHSNEINKEHLAGLDNLESSDICQRIIQAIIHNKSFIYFTLLLHIQTHN